MRMKSLFLIIGVEKIQFLFTEALNIFLQLIKRLTFRYVNKYDFRWKRSIVIETNFYGLEFLYESAYSICKFVFLMLFLAKRHVQRDVRWRVKGCLTIIILFEMILFLQ